MKLEEYRQPSPARIRLYLSLWVILWITAFIGRRSKGNISVKTTLKHSPFARVMFMDIGALSTLAGLYLVLTGKSRLRYPAAVAGLAVGSYSLLPALAYEDWKAMKEAEGGK
ncbi:DUF2834 domain-containing protein [Deinococcus saxicola]|uniref:hypothetical protein n=1 Tax=Deinococcus saxicola TaxID=249406 RepID=UPI0039F048A9